MDLAYAEIVARREMDRFEELRDWSFRFNNRKSGCGLCNSTKRRIELSRHYVELNPEDEVMDTILHEIAHALVGGEHNHDRVWRAKAIEIGCSGRRTGGAEVKMPPDKYGIYCKVCEKVLVTRRARRINLKGKLHKACKGEMEWIEMK